MSSDENRLILWLSIITFIALSVGTAFAWFELDEIKTTQIEAAQP